jgi:hypothetical protein
VDHEPLPLTVTRLLTSTRPLPAIEGACVWITHDKAVSITGGTHGDRVAAVQRLRASAA